MQISEMEPVLDTALASMDTAVRFYLQGLSWPAGEVFDVILFNGWLWLLIVCCVLFVCLLVGLIHFFVCLSCLFVSLLGCFFGCLF